MQGQQEQADDVKDRYVNILKPVNHHRINVVAIERIEFKKGELRIEFAGGEVEEMKNNEREHDQSAHDHVPRRPSRFDVIPLDVTCGTGAFIFDGEQDREINMQNHGREQNDSNKPEQWTEIAQMLRVSVDPFRAEKDLEIAEQMSDDKKD